MKRRAFITLLGGAAAWPLTARAAVGEAVDWVPLQPTAIRDRGPTARISPRPERDRLCRGTERRDRVPLEGQTDRLPLLVADLLRRQVAVIIGNTPSALAAKAAPTTVPIVFVTGGDPVRDGLVANLNRPGGNVTGVSFMSVDLAAKQLGLLRELRPGAARIGLLVDPKWPLTEPFVSQVRAAASTMGQQIEVLYVSSDREIETAFTTLVQHGAGALHVGVGVFLTSQRERIVALAARHRIPLIAPYRDFPAVGGLMSYGTNIPNLYRQAAIYASRILKGEKPGDLPVTLPTKFELVINVKTAKTLGIEIPDRLLALADEVME